MSTYRDNIRAALIRTRRRNQDDPALKAARDNLHTVARKYFGRRIAKGSAEAAEINEAIRSVMNEWRRVIGHDPLPVRRPLHP